MCGALEISTLAPGRSGRKQRPVRHLTAQTRAAVERAFEKHRAASAQEPAAIEPGYTTPPSPLKAGRRGRSPAQGAHRPSSPGPQPRGLGDSPALEGPERRPSRQWAGGWLSPLAFSRTDGLFDARGQIYVKIQGLCPSPPKKKLKKEDCLEILQRPEPSDALGHVGSDHQHLLSEPPRRERARGHHWLSAPRCLSFGTDRSPLCWLRSPLFFSPKSQRPPGRRLGSPARLPVRRVQHRGQRPGGPGLRPGAEAPGGARGPPPPRRPVRGSRTVFL